MNRAEFRFANKADVPTLAKINLQAWQYAYKNIYSEQILQEMDLNLVRLEKGWLTAIDDIDKKIFVLEVNSSVCGYLRYGKIRPVGLGGYEIFQLYLQPTMIGKGMGRKLLIHAQKKIKESGGRYMVVRVAEKNLRARKFYEKYGFIQKGPVEIDCSVTKTGIKIVCYKLDPL